MENVADEMSSHPEIQNAGVFAMASVEIDSRAEMAVDWGSNAVDSHESQGWEVIQISERGAAGL